MITIWMIVASPAYALDPWALPLGVHTDMEACLDGDATACQDAAARFPDPAWAAWLGGDSGAALSDDARRVFRALRCADDDATACRQLGLDLLGAEDGATRVRGEILLVRACGMGETVACSAAGVYAKTPEAAWQEVTRSEGAGAPSSRDLAAASKACAKDKSPGPACVEVIRLVDRNAGSEVGMRAAAAAARLACDKEPGGAACALAADAEPKEAPALPELASSYALLRQTCDGFYLERACHVAAGLHELGLTQPYGDLATFVSRKRACDEGDDSSCAALTTTLRGPTGSRHQAACEALAAGNGGDPRACSAYAVMLQFGVGTTKDEAKADRMRTLACEKGAATSCDEIADDTWDEDSLASFTWYQRACVAGHPNGCEVSGRMRLYGESGVTTDVQGALADLRRGCDAHSHYACSTLGFGLYSGDATPIDPPGAWRAALSGCSLGSLDACSLVAFMMFDGIGTTKDVAGAVLLGSWVCLHGDADACEFLGDIYTNGEGVPKDEGRAAWAWARGCEMFDAISSDIEGAENTCCENVDEDAVETPIASSPLPTHRPASSWREPVSETVVIDDGPGPRPHPGPVSFGRAALSVGVSLGTQRSWTAASQASVIRFSLEVPLIRGLGVGADLDLVSDSRLRPKVARSYWRTTGFVNLAFGLPIRGPVYLSLGVGPGIGGFRAGPGTTNPIALSYGVHELLQLGVRLDKFTAGLRLEQQQLWQTGSPDIDHVTGLYGIVGGSFD